ncbi:alpha/beta fold hydrolase [Streptomyces sp. NPDC127079]|uniref:alpha/beta fold hydrolase n=1 Tax=Streptomyces sp. NPDC127079 TaxID=3347132 RepID=UPI003661F9AC
MTTSRNSPTHPASFYTNTPTRTVSVQGVDFAYRELGPREGVPIVLLMHLAGVLDNWDPRVVDGLAAQRRVIAFDNRGVGGSGGSTPDTPSTARPKTTATAPPVTFRCQVAHTWIRRS